MLFPSKQKLSNTVLFNRFTLVVSNEIYVMSYTNIMLSETTRETMPDLSG